MSSEEDAPHRHFVLIELPFSIPVHTAAPQSAGMVSQFMAPTALALNSILATHAPAEARKCPESKTLTMGDPTCHSGKPVGYFESTGPRILSVVHARNDMILKVTRKFVRRKRQRGDGTIEVTETPLGEQYEPQLEWIGVVSRSSSLAKPADFIFDNGNEARRAASAFTHPPDWFIQPRAPSSWSYYYQQGKQRSLGGKDVGTGDGKSQMLTGRSGTYFSQDVVVSCELPPAPWPQHIEYVEALRKSNAPEVAEIEALLGKKPVWRMSDLFRALADSGRCPRLHVNVEVIRCSTYSILSGPFSRLRIRYGFDPTRERGACLLQRMTLRWGLPTSPLAILIRDCSRAPQVRDAIAAIEADDAVERRRLGTEQANSSLFPTVWSTARLFSTCIVNGSLFTSFQINDVLDDKFIAAELDDPLVVCDRNAIHGWFREASYRRCTAHIADEFAAFIKARVIPKLRAEQQRERLGSAPAAVPIVAEAVANEDLLFSDDSGDESSPLSEGNCSDADGGAGDISHGDGDGDLFV